MNTSTRLIGTAVALTLALTAAPAWAASAWWHGVRSDNWKDGVSGGQSNWYSLAPPNGTAQPVPDKTAKFAPGAKTFDVSIGAPTTVETMDFRSAPPRYTFTVTDTFSLTGKGVLNPFAIRPLFIVRAIMSFLNNSNTGFADYEIKTAGTLTVDSTRGPANNHLLQIGSVTNSGRFDVGQNTLRMRGDYQQTAQGLLKFDKTNTVGGKIFGNHVTIAGEVVVEGRRALTPGRYLLIDAVTLVGKFTTANFFRFDTTKVKCTVVYENNNVVLVVTKK